VHDVRRLKRYPSIVAEARLLCIATAAELTYSDPVHIRSFHPHSQIGDKSRPRYHFDAAGPV
jgi:hypothetical protein